MSDGRTVTGLRVGIVAAMIAGVIVTYAGGGAPTTTTTTSVTDGTDPLMGGKGLAYTVQVTNTGGIDATSLSCATTLDASLSYVSSSGTGWSCGVAGQVVTCTLATLAVGPANPITINVTSSNTTASISTSAATSGSNFSTSNGSQSTQINAVTRDATSGIYLPTTSAEWATALLQAGIASGGPSSSWDFTSLPSGNASDLIGSNTLTVSGASWAYQQAVTGWSKTALTVPDGLAGHNAQNTTTVPDIGTTSGLLIAVVAYPTSTPAATRRMFRWNSTGVAVGINATPKFTATSGGAGGSTANGTAVPTSTVQPVILEVNRTATSNVVDDFQEELVPGFGTYSGLALGFGSSGSNSCGCQYLTAAMFTGAAAELTQAQRRTLLQVLGWTVAW